MWQVIEGDAMTLLSRLAPAAAFDVVMADPPYNSGGHSTAQRTGMSARRKYVSSPGHPAGANHDLPDFEGDNRDQRSYTVWLTLILAECWRLTRLSGSLLLFTDWRQLPASSDALQAAGWIWRGVVPWHKPIHRPRRGGFAAACEYILWASRGPIDAAAHPVYLPGWYSCSQPRGTIRRHITAKPVELLRQLLRVTPARASVLDPFAGSGSAGEAAIAEGHDYLGIELSPTYAAVARARLTALAGPETVSPTTTSCVSPTVP